MTLLDEAVQLLQILITVGIVFRVVLRHVDDVPEKGGQIWYANATSGPVDRLLHERSQLDAVFILREKVGDLIKHLLVLFADVRPCFL